MTVSLKASVSLAGIAVVASGVVLWAHFGEVIVFDLAASGFIGCFY